MDLKLREADLEFQGEVRAFIDRHWPRARARADAVRRIRRVRAQRRHERHWFDALVARGWSVPSWPVEFGGTGWTPTQHYIWDRETARAGCPQMSPFGARMLAPVLYTWGTPEQQAQHLPPDPRSARAMVSGLFGTGRRLRSRGACGRARCAMATITSSMARRRGRAARIAPIGCSASCAPIRARRRSSRASVSC